MQRNWTNIGAHHTNTPRLRSRIENAIDRLEWKSIPCELGMMPGLGIKQAIKELHIPKVTEVAVSSELAPYGLYGIRGHYKNGMAEVYIVDEGSAIVPVVSYFYPLESPGPKYYSPSESKTA